MSSERAPDGSILDSPFVAEEAARPASANIQRNLGTLTALAVASAIIFTLYIARAVLVPIALAILLSFMLAPAVRRLRRAGLHRVPAVLIAISLALGVILSLGGLIGMQASQIVSELPAYASVIDQKITRLRDFATAEFSGVASAFTNRLPRALTPASLGTSPNAPGGQAKPPPVEVHQADPTPLELAGRLLPPVALPLASTGVVFVVAIFILLQQADLRDRLIRLFGLQDLHRTTRALDDAARRLTRYLVAQLAMNALFGLIVGIGLALIGVPNPLLWGTLATLFRFLPYLGSVLCAVLPVALAAALDPGWHMAIYTALLFIVTEIVMGQFADPLAFGHSTGMSPLSVVVAALFWTWMWGPIGLPLSMPLTLCLVVLGRYVKQLEFLEILMGDRPALTPVESFCQRMLANDPEEALEYAEDLLKDQPLIAYYDNVVIKGLQLAASDLERSDSSAILLGRIQVTMNRLIQELETFKDPPSPLTQSPETANGTVLCVAGGGPLDRVVANILAQLLIRRGVAARVVAFGAVSRGSFEEPEPSSLMFISVCYLDISLNTAQPRYLVRRLRQFAPNVPVLAALRPGTSVSGDEAVGSNDIGADYYVGTLAEAVEFQVPPRHAKPLVLQADAHRRTAPDPLVQDDAPDNIPVVEYSGNP
jgi:predicted PurR-regulated permease PerM